MSVPRKWSCGRCVAHGMISFQPESRESMIDLPGTMPDPKHRLTLRSGHVLCSRGLGSSAKSEPEIIKAKDWLGNWWPVAVGVILAVWAPLLRDLLVALDPWGMRVVFPFVVVAGREEVGMGAELTRMLPQLVLFLQFPLEGLLTRDTLNRGGTVKAAAGELVFVHAVCVLVLWLISQAPQ